MLSTWRHRSRFDAQRWPQRNRNQTKEAFIKQRQAVETPVVLRVPSLAADAMKRCQEGVDAVTFGAAVDSARRAGEKRDLLFAAAAPMRKLIEQDEKALASLRKLAGVRKSRLKGRVVSVLSHGGGMFPETSFNLTPGLHVFAPPFDLGRPEPTAGSPVNSGANRNTGELFVNVPYDSDAHGLRAAAASISIIFQPSTTGTLSIRPCAKYAHSWLVAGLHRSAHTQGQLVITASRADDGQVLDNRSVTLWDMTTKSDVHSGDDQGVAWPPDCQVNFLAESGHNYLASMTATVSGDQSGDKSILFFPSWSMFCGCISASVPWLVAELRT